MGGVLVAVARSIPQVLLGSLFRNPGNDPLSLQAYITVNNTIFLFVAISVAYGMVRRGPVVHAPGGNVRLPEDALSLSPHDSECCVSPHMTAGRVARGTERQATAGG